MSPHKRELYGLDNSILSAYLRVGVKWMDGPPPWFILVFYFNELKHKVSH